MRQELLLVPIALSKELRRCARDDTAPKMQDLAVQLQSCALTGLTLTANKLQPCRAMESKWNKVCKEPAHSGCSINGKGHWVSFNAICKHQEGRGFTALFAFTPITGSIPGACRCSVGTYVASGCAMRPGGQEQPSSQAEPHDLSSNAGFDTS